MRQRLLGGRDSALGADWATSDSGRVGASDSAAIVRPNVHSIHFTMAIAGLGYWTANSGTPCTAPRSIRTVTCAHHGAAAFACAAGQFLTRARAYVSGCGSATTSKTQLLIDPARAIISRDPISNLACDVLWGVLARHSAHGPGYLP